MVNMPAEDEELQTFDGENIEEVADMDGNYDVGDDSDLDEDYDDQAEDMETIDESKFIFPNHEGSIFCLDISQNQSPIVVTGGEDDKGYVWNFDTQEILFECGGHKDSVTSCGFSSDSKYVMTADMGGTINVYNVSDGKTVWDYECSDLEWCKWHTTAHVLFAGTTSGDVYMWKVPSGDCKIYASHGSKTTGGTVTPNGKEIVVSYEDGSLKKWDLRAVSCLFHYQSDNQNAILSIDVLSVGQKNGNLVACGTYGGSLKIINLHSGKLISEFAVSSDTSEDTNMEEEVEEEAIPVDAIESVVFSPCGSYVTCGSLNGNLCIWDISNQRIRHECRNPAGISKLVWSEIEPNYIISACLDGIVRMWDHKNGELFKEYYGHVGNVLDITISGDGKYILTAGDDGTARLFEK